MTSVIIPIRFRADLTEVCIDSVLNYSRDVEIIAVQEGEDEEITRLLKSYSCVKFVQNKVPKGFAGAMNTGISVADPATDYYCFLNNDTVATPHWLDEMLKVFSNPEVGLVTPTFSGTNTRQAIEWNDGREVEYIYDPFKLMGVCFLIPKKVIDQVGLWDERFGLGGEEDYDMHIRISNQGYIAGIARKAFIYHYWGASFKELFDQDMEKCMAHARGQFEILEKKHNLQILP